ncbi:MAG: hypothetical protein FJ125_07595, partial [Deltaproteobacteria bacterium]|nr:hypothetical protein [Deltaproteobacteria bacterium]
MGSASVALLLCVLLGAGTAGSWLAGCGEEESPAIKTVYEGERIDTRQAPLTLSAVRPGEVPASGGMPVVAVGTGFVEGISVSVAGAT